VALVLAVALVPSRALAQEQPISTVPDPAETRLRFGPLLVNPTLSLTNAGVDTNTFHEAEIENPKKDFNIVVTPEAALWMRFGRTWFNGLLREDLVWFRTYSSERSGNGRYAVGWFVPLTRVTIDTHANWTRTRERPAPEIDSRSDRRQQAAGASIEIRALPGTFFGARVNRAEVDFDEASTFDGVNLHDELNRVSTSEALTVRHELTPLTSLTLDLVQAQDRFDFSPDRDSDSSKVLAGVKLDPFALISGTVQVGYRRFEPKSPGLDGFDGVVVQAGLTYVLRDSTKVTVSGSRDLQYSYDADQPYYLQSGLSGSVSQRIHGPVDVEARAGSQRLAYSTRKDVVVEVADRMDRVRTYGAGLGYHVRPDLRVALNVDHDARKSEVSSHEYQGLRYGAAVTYGF